MLNSWLTSMFTTHSAAATHSVQASHTAQLSIPSKVMPAVSKDMELIVSRKQLARVLAVVQELGLNADVSAPLFQVQVSFVESDTSLMSPFYSAQAEQFVAVRFSSWDQNNEDVVDIFQRIHVAFAPLQVDMQASIPRSTLISHELPIDDE